MKKETWIQVRIWEGTKLKVFTKYIKGELLIPSEKTKIYPTDSWTEKEIRDHMLYMPNRNTIVSMIRLEPVSPEELGDNMDTIRKELKKFGYKEEH